MSIRDLTEAANKVVMGEVVKGKVSASGKGEVSYKNMLKKYDDNEDKNYHTENSLMLVKAFGTNAEIKKVKANIIKQKRDGGKTAEDSAWEAKTIHGKYHSKLVALAKRQG